MGFKPPPPFIGRLKLWFPGYVFTSRVGVPPVKLKGYSHVPPPLEKFLYYAPYLDMVVVSGKKNLEIKTLEKKSEFSQVLGKNVTGNKVLCFGFLGLFFLK